ncbi:hypothetical protein FE360_01590 [Helicobacter pylori]|uniref:hypothetical protein n=1 Tax=Helicobacter pylori TaxID=210 RepID=UPI0013E40AD9|nr:hypothetical protein [Helicobacter pylori]WQW93938.1 hypothetical protein FE360_01590 [Helicobacter pylori]
MKKLKKTDEKSVKNLKIEKRIGKLMKKLKIKRLKKKRIEKSVKRLKDLLVKNFKKV